MKMSKLRILNIAIICSFLLTAYPVSVIFTVSIPIISTEEVNDSFIPKTYREWDYYLLPPGTRYENVYYWGTTTTGSQSFYTTASSTSFGYTGSALTHGNQISGNFRQNTTRSSAHPFFPDEPYPRAVRIDNDSLPIFNQTMMKPLSLHMNYSSTIFASDTDVYWGYIESDEPFFIDVSISASNVEGVLIFDSALPEGYIIGIPENKMTYPVFPTELGLQTFMLAVNDSTLLTLTPHPWEFPSYIPTLNISTVTTGELNQGSPWYYNETTNQYIDPDNVFFSIRMFQVEVQKGKAYRINALFDMEYIKPGVLSEEPVRFLYGEHYEYVSGDIDQDGMVINAKETETITLVLYSPGEANGEYSIFYQELPPFEVIETEDLVLNADWEPEEDIMYTFTLNSPHMIRANWTDTFEYRIYVPAAESGDWIEKTNQNFIGITTWQYLPAGTYGVWITDLTTGELLRFTAIPVQDLSETFDIEDNTTILAIEIPLIRNRIIGVNVSTTDQINQSIAYNYVVASKYNEFVGADSGSFTIGNEQVNGNWQAASWAANGNLTEIEEYWQFCDRQAPILVINASSMSNGTHSFGEFAGTLTITAGIVFDETSTARPFAIYSGYDAYLPKDPISTDTTYYISDDDSSDDDHVFAIPLNLNPYELYNITLYVIGNNSNTADLNVTLNDFDIYGGNYANLAVFGTETSTIANNTMNWKSALILTVSTLSYLYVDLQREDDGGPLYNATMLVSIESLNAPIMSFDLDVDYNPIVGDREVFTETYAASQVIPPEMINDTITPSGIFPLEIILLVGGVVGVGVIAGAGVYFYRKRRFV